MRFYLQIVFCLAVLSASCIAQGNIACSNPNDCTTAEGKLVNIVLSVRQNKQSF